MARILGSPMTFLLLQGSLIFTWVSLRYGVVGRFTNVDSWTYFQFTWEGLAQTLEQPRTFGYPLFLQLYHAISPNLYLFPQLQVALFVCAVLFFYTSLRSYGFAKWTAFVAASPLFYATLLREHAVWVMSEVLAGALVIATVGLTFRACGATRPWWVWIGSALALFLTYQVRPAYVFLILLVPGLLAVLGALRVAGERPYPSLKRIVGTGLAVSVLPFLAFCSLRYGAVGDFGVVSYGGYNLMSITTQFMTNDMVSGFDEDLRPLARAIIEERDKRGIGVEPGRLHVPLDRFGDLAVYYSWELFGPLALKYRQGDDIDIQNLKLGGAETYRMANNRVANRLAAATFKARPGVHALFYVKSFLYGIARTLVAEPNIVVLLVIVFPVHCIASLLRSTPGSERSAPGEAVAEMRELNAVLIVGALFYLAALFTVILVSPPYDRYLQACAMFLPCILATAGYVTAFALRFSPSCSQKA